MNFATNAADKWVLKLLSKHLFSYIFPLLPLTCSLWNAIYVAIFCCIILASTFAGGGSTQTPFVVFPNEIDDVPKLSLPTFGMASYKFKESMWTQNGGVSEYQRANSLMQAADKWLRLLHVNQPDFKFFASHSVYQRWICEISLLQLLPLALWEKDKSWGWTEIKCILSSVDDDDIGCMSFISNLKMFKRKMIYKIETEYENRG